MYFKPYAIVNIQEWHLHFVRPELHQYLVAANK